jgi:2-desacetyl-2-hydroxyethyl bacteriochlorophyllide A dehydrogenase
MRAARFHTFGDPSVLRIEQVAQPRPKHDEVLIRVAATSVNGADLGARQGHTRLIHARRMPMIPGYDVAGEVVECGPRVTSFMPDERVFGLVGLAAGGSAEYICVAQRKLARVPERIRLSEAAAVPLAGLTALQGLRARGQAQAGQRVLIIGAAGGVGSFAVQLAKVLGCHVTAVCRTSKVDLVAGLGADEVIDYTKHDYTARSETWDLVFDASGVQEFDHVQGVLNNHGVMVGTRGSPKSLLAAMRTRLHGGPRFAFFVTRASGHDLALLARLIDQGRLRTVVDRIFPLEEVADAHRYVEGGNARGKVVVQIASGDV